LRLNDTRTGSTLHFAQLTAEKGGEASTVRVGEAHKARQRAEETRLKKPGEWATITMLTRFRCLSSREAGSRPTPFAREKRSFGQQFRISFSPV